MPGRLYIKLILPLRLEWEPCYYIPLDEFGDAGKCACRVGDRIAVKFAGRKEIGVVSETDAVPDVAESKIQPVESIDTGLPPVSEEEIKLWRFIAEYYLCSVGEVYKAAYPRQKTASEKAGSKLRQRKEILEERTRLLWQGRIKKLKARLGAKDAELGKKHNDAVRARLQEQRAAISAELAKAEKILSQFDGELEMSSDYSKLLNHLPEGLNVSELAQGKPLVLNSGDRINYYIKAAAGVLRAGRNVLILVNETALTSKLQDSLLDAFGELLLVHHSKMTQTGRRRISADIRSGRPHIIIGTRSSIFLPFRELGLIIVDNEESPFYKQSDSAPRYNARDCAIELSLLHRCPVVLGSVSPSLETIYNLQCRKYTAIDTERPESRPFELIDMQAERRKNGVIGPLSRKLLHSIARAKGKIAVIRGFEKEDDLRKALSEFAPEKVCDILTIPQAARTGLEGYGLIAMCSADALFDPADFRSDKRAFQYLERLRSSGAEVVLQTSQSAHQVFHLNACTPLLAERRQFGLPPYTRVVDIEVASAVAPEGLSRELRLAGFAVNAFGPVLRISLPRNKMLLDNKRQLAAKLAEYKKSHPRERFIINVDPA